MQFQCIVSLVGILPLVLHLRSSNIFTVVFFVTNFSEIACKSVTVCIFGSTKLTMSRFLALKNFRRAGFRRVLHACIRCFCFNLNTKIIVAILHIYEFYEKTFFLQFLSKHSCLFDFETLVSLVRLYYMFRVDQSNLNFSSRTSVIAKSISPQIAGLFFWIFFRLFYLGPLTKIRLHFSIFQIAFFVLFEQAGIGDMEMAC